MWHFCVRVFNKVAKRTDVPKDGKSDGFYGLKNEAVRWIYGRKERSELKKALIKALIKAEELEKPRSRVGDLANDGVAVSGGSRPSVSTGSSNGHASANGAIIDGRELSTTGTHSSNGVSGSAGDSVQTKRRRFGGNMLRGSRGNSSDKSAV